VDQKGCAYEAERMLITLDIDQNYVCIMYRMGTLAYCTGTLVYTVQYKYGKMHKGIIAISTPCHYSLYGKLVNSV
jgi:hypothetical protein